MPTDELSFLFSVFWFAAEPEMEVLVPDTESATADLGDSSSSVPLRQNPQKAGGSQLIEIHLIVHCL